MFAQTFDGTHLQPQRSAVLRTDELGTITVITDGNATWLEARGDD